MGVRHRFNALMGLSNTATQLSGNSNNLLMMLFTRLSHSALLSPEITFYCRAWKKLFSVVRSEGSLFDIVKDVIMFLKMFKLL